MSLTEKKNKLSPTEFGAIYECFPPWKQTLNINQIKSAYFRCHCQNPSRRTLGCEPYENLEMFLLFSWKAREKERRERTNLPVSNFWFTPQMATMMQPRIVYSICILHRDGVDPSKWAIFCTFSGILSERWVSSRENPGFELTLQYGMLVVQASSVIHCATMCCIHVNSR